MSTLFDLASFFRRVSTPLLQRVFAHNHAFADFDWSAVGPRKIDPLLKRFQTLSQPERRQAFWVFQRAESLANSIGTRVLIEVGQEKDRDIGQKLTAKPNAHDRALWMCLEYPEVIPRAMTLATLENFSKRMFESRQGLPAQQLQVTSQMKAALCDQIVGMFEPECRGEHCYVEHMQREGGIECFFVYSADYWSEQEVFNRDGRFERTAGYPAFQIVLAYHSTTGVLDVYAEGGAKVRSRLAHIFARAVLGLERELYLPTTNSFNLELLKDPHLTFPTVPADRISQVRVQSMTLKFWGTEPGLVDFSIDGRRRGGCLHRVIAHKLREPAQQLREATVTSAVLQVFSFTPSGQERSLRFRISTPSRCDLGDSPLEGKLRVYLRQWGIENDADRLATAA
jgi:hypothetical protein